ncbi:LPS export ABC transporter periplasmic protein LptC [Halomonas qinghailakensis]|uniref:LPS export ABC transporter periplasmic protein LptC n=1 Tax=Halomonas qinghailakensis TaxID=2937790 RepID=A0AA46YN89_9GAMM|nr:LPS export ABC transporter periplasmic protein LptC [Halomonas sp. ZZQ-149]UYO74109.1 LPS export ABC transporter periplasmic protein LptC [Halomonas sp. ZZQ-149]
MRFWVRKRFWITTLVVVLGGVLAWIDPRGYKDQSFNPDARAQEPGHVLENAEMTLFGDTGTIQQSLMTPRLVHTPQTAMTDVTSPIATLFDSEERQWLATAETGTLNTDTQALTLAGSAQLLSPDEGWQLNTELLHYNGVTRHAWSDSKTVLQQPPQRLDASRMDIWLDDSQIRLTNNVRGTHPPATRSP